MRAVISLGLAILSASVWADSPLERASSSFYQFHNVTTFNRGYFDALGRSRVVGGDAGKGLLAIFDPPGGPLAQSITFDNPHPDYTVWDEFTACALDAAGNQYVVGWSQKGATLNQADFVIVKYTSAGVLSPTWGNIGYGQGIRVYIGGQGEDVAVDVAVSGNFLYVLGRARRNTTTTDFDLVVLKYDINTGLLSNTWPDAGNGVGVRRSPPIFGGTVLPRRLYVLANGEVMAVGSIAGDLGAIRYNGGGFLTAYRLIPNPDLVESYGDSLVTPSGDVLIAGSNPSNGLLYVIRSNGSTTNLVKSGEAFDDISLDSLSMPTLSGRAVVSGRTVAKFTRLDTTYQPAAAWPDSGSGIGVRLFDPGGAVECSAAQGDFGESDAFGALPLFQSPGSGGTDRRAHYVRILADGTLSTLLPGFTGFSGSKGVETFRDAEGRIGFVSSLTSGAIGSGGFIRYGPARTCMLDSFQVTEGEHFAGGLAELLVQDDVTLSMFNDIDSLGATIEFFGHTPAGFDDSSLVGLNFRISVGRPGLLWAIAFWDGPAHQWGFSSGGSPSITPVSYFFSRPNHRTQAGIELGSGRIGFKFHFQPINDEDPAQDGWLHLFDVMDPYVVR